MVSTDRDLRCKRGEERRVREDEIKLRENVVNDRRLHGDVVQHGEEGFEQFETLRTLVEWRGEGHRKYLADDRRHGGPRFLQRVIEHLQPVFERHDRVGDQSRRDLGRMARVNRQHDGVTVDSKSMVNTNGSVLCVPGHAAIERQVPDARAMVEQGIEHVFAPHAVGLEHWRYQIETFVVWISTIFN